MNLYLGVRDYLIAELDVSSRYHLTGPAMFTHWGLASGLGTTNRNMLRIGISTSEHDSKTGYYIGGDWLINDRFLLQSYLSVHRYVGFSVGLQYHMGPNRWKPLKPQPARK